MYNEFFLFINCHLGFPTIHQFEWTSPKKNTKMQEKSICGKWEYCPPQ